MVMAAGGAVKGVELNSAPAAPEEPMEAGSTKFEENIWYKKYQLLKRKCSEFEQLNDILFSRTKKIRLMIDRAEAEKRSLMKRLEQFEVVEFPKARLAYGGKSPDNLSELDCTLPSTAARVRGELEASKATESTLNSIVRHQVSKVSAPPPLIGPLADDQIQSGIPSVTTKVCSLRIPSTTVNLPAVAAPVPNVTTTTIPSSSAQAGKGKKATKKDGSTAQKASTKKRKGDADPNAPKKPSNAFFWFCQDKRAALQEQVKVEGLGGQHDLTKALARLWSETKTEDKKIYYEKYATDKARYDREMEDYHRSKQSLMATTAATSTTPLTHVVQRAPPALLQVGEEVAAEP